MTNGDKVKINENTFSGLTHLNGVIGKVSGKGKSGETFAVSLPNGGVAYVEEKNLTLVQ